MYELVGQTKKHGWSQKLAMGLFNMNLNNTYHIYTALCAVQHPGFKPKPLLVAIQDAAHSLLHQGDAMRTRGYGHVPSPVKDLRFSNLPGNGRKLQSDQKGQYNGHQGRVYAAAPERMTAAQRVARTRVKFRRTLESNKWRTHQSMDVPTKTWGHCN